MGVIQDAYDYLVFYIAAAFGGTGGGGGGAFYSSIYQNLFDGEFAHFAAPLSCAPMIATVAAIVTVNAFRTHAPVAVAKDIFMITCVANSSPGV